MKDKQKVLIAGAGIGGLTAGLALMQRGFDVEVFEQAPRLAEVGAGIQLSPNGTRCLHSLGLETTLRQLASVPNGKEVRLWNTGQNWKLFDLGAQAQEQYGHPYLMMHRADLHLALAEALSQRAGGALHLARRAIGFTQDEDGVELELDNGLKVSGDFLIAGDGVHSRVREQLFGDDAASFTGCVAWRGLIPMAALPERFHRSVGVNWIGPGAHVINYPLRRGELLNFVGIVERGDWQVESWTERGSIDECLRDFAGWHDDVRLLIGHIEQPFKWALMSRAPRGRWSQGRVTLLGDAAHPTLPFLAQGANMAIEDGIVLARCLQAAGGDPAGLVRYQQLRAPRTARIVQGSADAAKRFHNPALADQAGAQSYVDREWSEENVRARYGWLFSYDALSVDVMPCESETTM